MGVSTSLRQIAPLLGSSSCLRAASYCAFACSLGLRIAANWCTGSCSTCLEAMCQVFVLVNTCCYWCNSRCRPVAQATPWRYMRYRVFGDSEMCRCSWDESSFVAFCRLPK
ncbi:hypothetical protein EJ03DRAFT_164160 [Teratosphaeria nubilosa]|uniref:Uncharacterized protein n=1 Tax=Teratosphaeria nubilosa TaxID=161662 RepID=A0A6G1L298_9PEZI|nr:hypothetical protein EJ03DRAFT_164160 [Teratosphaeria nubilosa]